MALFGDKAWETEFRRSLDELRSETRALSQRLDLIEHQMRTFPVEIEDLAEKAKHAIRRLSKRVSDAERAGTLDGGETPASHPDQITAAIQARRRGRHGVPGQSSG